MGHHKFGELEKPQQALRRILLWTVMPTHHQDSFIAALRTAGFDVVVHYYDRISEDRLALGWRDYQTLPEGERYVPQTAGSLSLCADWRERVHILPGYARPFLVALAIRLSLSRVRWLHWSEPSRSYIRSLSGHCVRRFYGTLVDRYALGALAIGELAKRDFQTWGVRAEKISYLPYSIAALTEAQSTLRDDPTAVRFLFLGALCHRKGIDVLLEAFARVLMTYPTAQLSLVGADQATGEYQALAGTLKIEHAVSFLPPVAAESVALPLAACDVLVLPSRFDGWGVVINEATSLGKAVIATAACGAAHHLISDGGNGFIVAPGNVGQLAQRMSDYCGNSALAAQHGIVSRRLFADVSPGQNARRFSRALSRFVDARDGGRAAGRFDS